MIKFEGHFDQKNLDSSELKNDAELIANRRGVEVIKTITDQDGNSTTAKFYLYHFMLPLRHGLAKNYQILPANVHLRLTFHRADAKKGLNINYHILIIIYY